MFILNKEVQDRVIAFNKYAQFLSQKFNVRVVLDGLKAQTDGTTIYLPNIASLSESEIEFLYCILLHEIGHIKHSEFTPESFAKIRTQNHFHLANAIEDARIENILMGEFDGAGDIFCSLYNNFIVDKIFMKKIFGDRADNIDEFFGLGLYLHHYLINLKEKTDLEAIIGKKVAVAVMKFVNKNKIDNILDKAKLNNWDDVIKLANKIYDLYFDSKKDTSDKTDIKQMTKAMDSSKDKLDTEELLKEINKCQEDIKNQKKNVDAVKDKHEDAINDLAGDIQKLQKQLDNLTNCLNSQEKINDLEESNKELGEKISKKEDHLRSIKEKMEKALKNQNKEKVADLNRIQSKHEALKKRLEDQIKTNKDEIKQTEKNHPPISEDEFDKKAAPIQEKLEKLLGEKGKLDGEIKEEVDKLNQLNQDYQRVVADETRKIVDNLKQVQQEMGDAGIDVDIIPEFQGNPDWDDATDVQKSFDDRATNESGGIVCGGKVSNVRDILTTLDSAKNKIEKIDITKIFQAKNNVDPFDTFNVKNSPIEKGPESFRSIRHHIPLTTAYDIIITKNSSDRVELTKIIVDNQGDFEAIKSIFRNRFKVLKKVKFKGNQDEGNLDQRALWQLAGKTCDKIWELPNPKIYNETVASIAIDVSGSMDKHEDEIKKIALMLSEGLTSVAIKHEVVGFHAPVCHEMREAKDSSDAYNRRVNNLETIVYRNFGDKSNNGIQNMGCHCTDNSDGESIALIGKRILKERAKRKILFILTDGRPYLSGSDVTILDQNLKDVIEWLTLNGVEIYAIGFDKQGNAFYKNYCNYISSSDLINFIKKL